MTSPDSVSTRRDTVVLVAGNHHDLYRLAEAVLATDPQHDGAPPTDQDLWAAARVIDTLLGSGG